METCQLDGETSIPVDWSCPGDDDNDDNDVDEGGNQAEAAYVV